MMKARKGYIHQKGQYSTGRWLKWYFEKRTCKRKYKSADNSDLNALLAMATNKASESTICME